MIGPVRNENGSPARDPLEKTINNIQHYCIATIEKVCDKRTINKSECERPGVLGEADGIIVITDREGAFDVVVHLEDPLRFISFRNLNELAEYLQPWLYERIEVLKP